MGGDKVNTENTEFAGKQASAARVTAFRTALWEGKKGGGEQRDTILGTEMLTDAERVLRFAANRAPPCMEEGGTGDAGKLEGKAGEDFENWFLAACLSVDVEGTGMISHEAFTTLQEVLDSAEGRAEGGGEDEQAELKGEIQPVEYRAFLKAMMAA